MSDMEYQDLKCPFCSETGFDLLGLKSHLLNGDCEVFNKLPTLTRVICGGAK